MTIRPAALVLFSTALALSAALPLCAADIFVSRYDDPVPDGCLAGDCSLREAVILANAVAGPDRILLTSGVYSIDRAGSSEDDAATGDLDLIGELEIVGVAASLTILDAGGLGETVFESPSGTPGDLTFRRLTIQNSDFRAMNIRTAKLTVDSCELRNNGADGASPTVQVSFSDEFSMTSSTITGASGAGVALLDTVASFENSTFAGNGQQEIGLFNGSVAVCVHCTIVDPSDGDPEVQVSDSQFDVIGSIVAGNCLIDSGSIVTGGGNVESPGVSCGLDHASDDVVADPKLGALAFHGGGTRTIQPDGASAAVSNALSESCPTFDQRGARRLTALLGCESGAFERREVNPPTPLFIDGFDQGDEEAWDGTTPG